MGFGFSFLCGFYGVFFVRAFLSQSVMVYHFFWWVRSVMVLRPPFRKEFRSCFASGFWMCFFCMICMVFVHAVGMAVWSMS